MGMETIHGATVIFPDPGGAATEAARGPILFWTGHNRGCVHRHGRGHARG